MVLSWLTSIDWILSAPRHDHFLAVLWSAHWQHEQIAHCDWSGHGVSARPRVRQSSRVQALATTCGSVASSSCAKGQHAVLGTIAVEYQWQHQWASKSPAFETINWWPTKVFKAVGCGLQLRGRNNSRERCCRRALFKWQFWTTTQNRYVADLLYILLTPCRWCSRYLHRAWHVSSVILRQRQVPRHTCLP